ncbi:MAG: antibiotic biosynthesis monooxygenase [Rhodospirillaceae bacterium]|jgi:autoinducer 2-degrading protein|nr:antibiotic biosynthesis monooxygenase [Rhodospirillaceae bacterium]OUU56336.1 MAG: antibiotic biosynthesis monooxygenase [Candidatus Endolissoclinum sp. TMED55]|tara:strand:+ start:245 stop:550 length:306 start_codon:yes stop_codon:yes gene_type:complete
MFVVTVNFSVKRNQIEQFKPLMLENARLSLELEPGCKQFDVCFDSNEPWECFLYEVYNDKPAFEMHLQMPHFKLFDAKVAEMLDNKIVKTLSLVQGTVLSS